MKLRTPSFHPQVEQLNAKLAELEEERTELAEYQRLDKQRRSLEFAIYDRELSEIKSSLDKARITAGLMQSQVMTAED